MIISEYGSQVMMKHGWASALSHAALHQAAIAVFCIGLRFSGNTGAAAAAMILALYALGGPRNTLVAFGVVWLITSLNPGIAPPVSGQSFFRYIVFLAGFVSVFFIHGHFPWDGRVSLMTFVTVVLTGFIIFHSLLFSEFPMISVLKVILWAIVFLTVITSWRMLTDEQHHQISVAFFIGLTLVMLVGWSLFFSPLGYTRNERGFQGLLNHPQNYGTVFGVFSAWALCRVLLLPRNVMIALFIVVSAVLSVFFSQTRTASFAMVLGVLVGITVARVFSGVQFRKLLPGFFRYRIVASLIILAVVGFASFPMWIDDLNSFLFKGYQVEALAQIYDASRGHLIDRMWSNIEQHPWSGIGFGLPSDRAIGEVEVDPIFGVPISVPIEKGVLPIMVLEEIGFFGFLLFALWVILLVRCGTSRGILATVIIITSLLINLGEAVLFSVGGIGLFLILLVGMAVSSPTVLSRGARRRA